MDTNLEQGEAEGGDRTMPVGHGAANRVLCDAGSGCANNWAKGFSSRRRVLIEPRTLSEGRWNARIESTLYYLCGGRGGTGSGLDAPSTALFGRPSEDPALALRRLPDRQGDVAVGLANATLTLNHLSKDAKREAAVMFTVERALQTNVQNVLIDRPTFDQLNDVFATLLAGNLLPYNMDGQRKGLGHTLSHCCAGRLRYVTPYAAPLYEKASNAAFDQNLWPGVCGELSRRAKLLAEPILRADEKPPVDRPPPARAWVCAGLVVGRGADATQMESHRFARDIRIPKGAPGLQFGASKTPVGRRRGHVTSSPIRLLCYLF